LTIYLQEITESAVGHADLDNLLAHAQEAGAKIDNLQAELLRRIPHDKLSLRGSELYLNFLQTARLMVNHFAIAAIMQMRLRELASPQNSATAQHR
ncbi:MAG: inorganic phosphate transporter, partial [Duodenibacillus sp.]|nr:inorganic phosphate transporter [Duodenibacillus sp.]